MDELGKEIKGLNRELILREKLALQRTTLANQTTFLSFLRTSMYFLVAGLSIKSLLNLGKGDLIHSSMYVISGILFIVGVYNYFRHRTKIARSKKHIGDFKIEFLEEE